MLSTLQTMYLSAAPYFHYDLIAARRLLCPDRRPCAELTHDDRRTVALQLRPSSGADAVEEVIRRNLDQTGYPSASITVGGPRNIELANVPSKNWKFSTPVSVSIPSTDPDFAGRPL